MTPGLILTNKTVTDLQVEKINPLPTKDIHVHIYTVYIMCEDTQWPRRIITYILINMRQMKSPTAQLFELSWINELWSSRNGCRLVGVLCIWLW